MYIRDSGILHHLLNIPDFQSLISNPVIGPSWEGYVVEQISHRIDNETELYFYRTHEGAECDLVLVKGNAPVLAVENFIIILHRDQRITWSERMSGFVVFTLSCKNIFRKTISDQICLAIH